MLPRYNFCEEYPTRIFKHKTELMIEACNSVKHRKQARKLLKEFVLKVDNIVDELELETKKLYETSPKD